MRESTKDIIAIFCSDLHLSIKPPLWRSNEPDWFAAMERPLKELVNLQKKYECPVYCAGDIFDKWNSPPELINFALDCLPNMIAVPGQHDLPNHNQKEIEKSAFWTLVKAKKITYIQKPCFVSSKLHFNIIPFPYGKPITPIKRSREAITIAIAHQYVWTNNYSYESAPIDLHIQHLKKQLTGYDLVIFGDNHKGFLTRLGKTIIFNCGGFMRRKSDEVNYTPMVGLLSIKDGIIPRTLDTSLDKYLEIQKGKIETESLYMEDFFKELEKLGDTPLDFTETMKQYLNKKHVNKKVQLIITQAMGLT